MQNYLPNKNYLALYLNSIGLEFSSALVLSFVGVNLFVQGLPLYLIFLYFGLEFIFRAAFSPLSSVLTAKYGFKKTILIANVLLIFYFLSLGLYETYPLIGFCSFMLHSLARGIYYPTKHYMQATFIDDGNRGRFLTLEIVITSLTAVLAISFATYSVVAWQSFLPVTILASAFLCLSSFSVLKLLDDLPPEETGGYRAVLNYFIAPSFRADRLAFAGFAANIGFNNVVLALLVFFVVESLKLFGVIMAAVFIVEMFFILLYGRFIDKNRLRSTKMASFFQVGSYATFLLALSPLLVALIKTVYDVIWNVFDMSFTARFHQKINKNGLLYSCSKEICLGLGAGLYCLLLAAIAYFWQGAVFEVALAMAAFGVIIVWKRFRD